MKYLVAPNYLEDVVESPSVFLAGGISNCPDWQSDFLSLLGNQPTKKGIIYNPRRVDFDMDDKSATKKQIIWEFKHLWKSDIIVFWFCKETIQPIVLLELGERLGQIQAIKNYDNVPSILIGIEDGYSREEDIIIQSELVLGKIMISRTLEDLALRTNKLLTTLERRLL